jgi:hypothetical protein
MIDTLSAQDGTTSTALWRLAGLGIMLGCSDIALAVGMMAILVVLIPSLPPLLRDFSLAISITFSGPILTAQFLFRAQNDRAGAVGNPSACPAQDRSEHLRYCLLIGECWRPTSEREFVIPANGLSANPAVESKLPRNQLAQHSLSRLFKVQ